MTNKKDIYILWFPLYFKKGRSAKSNLMLTDKKTLRKCAKKKKKKLNGNNLIPSAWLTFLITAFNKPCIRIWEPTMHQHCSKFYSYFSEHTKKTPTSSSSSLDFLHFPYLFLKLGSH